MELPESLFETILIWSEEGSDYLYNEEPQRAKELEEFVSSQKLPIKSLYRRSSYPPLMNAKVGDRIKIPQLTSWSLDSEMPDQKYEGIPSVKLVLQNTTVRGYDISGISQYSNEQEVIVGPGTLVVRGRRGDELFVDYL